MIWDICARHFCPKPGEGPARKLRTSEGMGLRSVALVAFAAIFIQDDFAARLADIDRDFAGDRAALADWCHKRRLWAEAKAEIEAALALHAENEKAKAIKDKAPDSDKPADRASKEQYQDKLDGLFEQFCKKYEELARWAVSKKMDAEAREASKRAAALYTGDAELEQKLLARLNQIRKLAGLDPVELDPTLSYGCRKHSTYLVRNEGRRTQGGNAHREDAGARGYTPEGAKAAAASVISWGADIRAVDNLIASLYHRLPLIDPCLKRVGIGSEKGGRFGSVVCIDSKSGEEPGDWKPEHVLYPADGQSDAGTGFVTEHPDPIPPKAKRPVGFPVTIQFRPGDRVTGAKISLTESGADVPGHVSTPEKPASGFPQSNTICLIPAAPLKSGATYTAKVTCTLNGKPFEKEWSFTTGK